MYGASGVQNAADHTQQSLKQRIKWERFRKRASLKRGNADFPSHLPREREINAFSSINAAPDPKTLPDQVLSPAQMDKRPVDTELQY